MSLNSTWVFSQLRMTLAKILVEFSPESPANEGRAHSMIWLVQIGWIKTIQTFSSDGGITWLVTRYFDVKIRMLGFWPMPKFSCAHDVRLCVKINIGYLGTSILSDGLPFFSPVEVPILGTLQRKNGYGDPSVSRGNDQWLIFHMSIIDVSLLYLWGVSFVFVTLLVYLSMLWRHRCCGFSILIV